MPRNKGNKIFFISDVRIINSQVAHSAKIMREFQVTGCKFQVLYQAT
jgi:hypothetical protein